MAHDVAEAVTLGYLTGGIVLTVVLHRRGHRQICHVLRSRTGLVLWAVFSLHLWTQRWDPVRHTSIVYSRLRRL